MAPEMIKGGAYGYAVDFWGLGCLLYEMLVGTIPFEGENLSELCKAILNREPRINSNNIVSPVALDLIAKVILL